MGNDQSCSCLRNGNNHNPDDFMGCNKLRKDLRFEEDVFLGCDNQFLENRKDSNAEPKTRKRGKNAPPKILLNSYNIKVRGFGSDQNTSAPITPLRNYEALDDYHVNVNSTQDHRNNSGSHAHPPPQPILSEYLRNSASYSYSHVMPHAAQSSASVSSSVVSGGSRDISPMRTCRRDSVLRAQVSSRNMTGSFEGSHSYVGRETKIESAVPTPSTVLSAASTPYGYASASQSLYASVESVPQAVCSPRSSVASTPRTNDRSWYAAQVLRETGSQRRFDEHYAAALESPSSNRTAFDSQSGLQCTESFLYGSAASSHHSSSTAHVLTFKRTIADMPMPRWAPERRDLFLGAIATLADVPYGSVHILEVTLMPVEYMCVRVSCISHHIATATPCTHPCRPLLFTFLCIETVFHSKKSRHESCFP
jgi:hypothetical protein